MGFSETPQVDVEKQKQIDDWLPITAKRNAKWWYSAFHNVTAMVGAGVLSLPYAMSELGWYICLSSFLYSVSVPGSGPLPKKSFSLILLGNIELCAFSIFEIVKQED